MLGLLSSSNPSPSVNALESVTSPPDVLVSEMVAVADMFRVIAPKFTASGCAAIPPNEEELPVTPLSSPDLVPTGVAHPIVANMIAV